MELSALQLTSPTPLTLADPNSPHTVTITGGTGSFGQALTAWLLSQPNGPKVRVLSRDEDKQERMAQTLPAGPRLTYILGDVRNPEALRRAFDGADAVVHAAALKRVGFGERFPDEFMLTNVLGAHNVVRAAIECNVPRSLLISTDKACSPLNNYGASKRLAEGLFTQGNSLGAGRGCRFASVRGGNIWNSRGSVMQVWREQLAAGKRIVVNGADTSRFHLTMIEWVMFAWDALQQMHGGEIFIPKAPAWRLTDLARAFVGEDFECLPGRPGDKAAEWLYSGDESYRVVNTGPAYVLEPPHEFRQIWNYQAWQGLWVSRGMPYASNNAPQVSRADLEQLVKELRS